MAKSITDGFIFQSYKLNEQDMLKEIMHGSRIDKNTTEFIEDIATPVKRSNALAYLMKILTSENCVLLVPKKPFPRPFKVIYSGDGRDKRNKKIYIDVTGLVKTNKNNRFNANIETLIAYLVSAKVNMVYNKIPKTYVNTSKNFIDLTYIYARLFTHIIDFVGNISNIPGQKEKMMYHAARYFIQSVAELDVNEDKVIELAAKAAGVRPIEAKTLSIVANEEDYKDLPTFIEFIKETFKLDRLTTTLFIEKWMYLYGPGTIFGAEYVPALITMITDAFCGVYLNNQKTIEKVLGTSLVSYGKYIIYTEIA